MTLKCPTSGSSSGGSSKPRFEYTGLLNAELAKITHINNKLQKKRKLVLLPEMYSEHFTRWIRNEASSTTSYKAAATVYEEFDRLPNFHAFWESSWQKINASLHGLFCENDLPVYMREHGETTFRNWLEQFISQVKLLAFRVGFFR